MAPGLQQVADQAPGHRMAIDPADQGFQPPAAAASGELVDQARRPDHEPGTENHDHQQQDQAPGEFGRQLQRGAEEHARQQIQGRPQQGRGHGKGGQQRGRQAQHAGQHRHDRANRSDETADEHALAAVAGEHPLARGQHLRPSAQRPQARDVIAELAPDSVAGQVAEQCPQRSREPAGGEQTRVEAHRSPDQKQKNDPGDENTDDGQRFQQCENKGGRHQQQRAPLDQLQNAGQNAFFHLRSVVMLGGCWQNAPTQPESILRSPPTQYWKPTRGILE